MINMDYISPISGIMLSNGEYQETHDHLYSKVNHSHFSFIHFLSFDKDEHQPPEFWDPLI